MRSRILRLSLRCLRSSREGPVCRYLDRSCQWAWRFSSWPLCFKLTHPFLDDIRKWTRCSGFSWLILRDHDFLQLVLLPSLPLLMIHSQLHPIGLISKGIPTSKILSPSFWSLYSTQTRPSRTRCRLLRPYHESFSQSRSTPTRRWPHRRRAIVLLSCRRSCSHATPARLWAESSCPARPWRS
jgi:hypothetical protein